MTRVARRQLVCVVGNLCTVFESLIMGLASMSNLSFLQVNCAYTYLHRGHLPICRQSFTQRIPMI